MRTDSLLPGFLELNKVTRIEATAVNRQSDTLLPGSMNEIKRKVASTKPAPLRPNEQDYKPIVKIQVNESASPGLDEREYKKSCFK